MKTFNPVFNFKYLEGHKFHDQAKEIAGTWCYLITPDSFKTDWVEQDRIFRSSIWDEAGMPVSLSFKKFFNWGESPLVPPPTTIKGLSIMEKIDGSTLIVSKYKGQLIVRTRGSFSYEHHENANEVSVWLESQPEIKNLEKSDTWMNSYIFEWYSPTHKIVIDYGDKPIFWLTNIIDHEDYSYWTQDELDAIADHHGLKRPNRYVANNIDYILSLGPIINDAKLKEGFCVYFNNDQEILKVKHPKYLAIHAFKSELSLEKMVDLFLLYNKPTYGEFISLINSQFDYECATYATPMVSKICDAAKEINKIVAHMNVFVEELRGEERKYCAESIIGAYGNTIKTSIAFNILDRKAVSNMQYKKLIAQLLRN